MKQPELKADYGPEITDEELLAALSQIEVPSPSTIKKDEYAFATRETWVDGRPYMINQRWAFTVTNKVDLGDVYQLSIVHELHEYAEGKEKVSSRKAERYLEKTEKEKASGFIEPQQWAVRQIVAEGMGFGFKAASAPTPRVTLHNLRFRKGRFAVPDFVKQREHCGGLAPEICRDSLTAYFLGFDQVNWDENGGQKYIVERVYSPDVPFLAGTLSPYLLSNDPDEQRGFIPGVIRSCVSTTLPVNGVPVQLTQCDEIKDFAFGKDDPPAAN